MSLETGRPNKEQIDHEFALIMNLEKAAHEANNWRDSEATNHYRRSFFDMMIRIQCGDLESVKMEFETQSSGFRLVHLDLPVISPAKRHFTTRLSKTMRELELAEYKVSDLLPAEDV